MLYWAVVFLALALVAAVFGFFGIAGGVAVIAKTLCYVFAGLAVLIFIGILVGLGRGGWRHGLD